MRKISVIIANRHSTSICLEDEFYDELKKIAAARGLSINALVTEIDAARNKENLSSAIRIYILNFILATRQATACSAGERPGAVRTRTSIT